VRASGYRGLFTGFWMTALRDVPSYGVYFVTYEAIVRAWVEEGSEMTVTKFMKMGVAGAAAGVAAWLPPIYQVDIVKTLIQTQDLKTPRFKSSWECFMHIVKHEGRAGLFRGAGSAIVRAIPVNGVTFAVYEMSLILLEDVF
jgi:solute carrier family 25 (mitochondrial carnitine/acylcarnitine transporter), member 20/29